MNTVSSSVMHISWIRVRCVCWCLGHINTFLSPTQEHLSCNRRRLRSVIWRTWSSQLSPSRPRSTAGACSCCQATAFIIAVVQDSSARLTITNNCDISQTWSLRSLSHCKMQINTYEFSRLNCNSKQVQLTTSIKLIQLDFIIYVFCNIDSYWTVEFCWHKNV